MSHVSTYAAPPVEYVRADRHRQCLPVARTGPAPTLQLRISVVFVFVGGGGRHAFRLKAGTKTLCGTLFEFPSVAMLSQAFAQAIWYNGLWKKRQVLLPLRHPRQEAVVLQSTAGHAMLKGKLLFPWLM